MFFRFGSCFMKFRPDNCYIQDYRSLYYDTVDRQFFLDHHNERVNRYKVRFREYVNSGLSFLEVKCKNNKKKTIKNRIQVDAISSDGLSEEQKQYIDTILGSLGRLFRLCFVQNKTKSLKSDL